MDLNFVQFVYTGHAWGNLLYHFLFIYKFVLMQIYPFNVFLEEVQFSNPK